LKAEGSVFCPARFTKHLAKSIGEMVEKEKAFWSGGKEQFR